jgi:hypothetical protein
LQRHGKRGRNAHRRGVRYAARRHVGKRAAAGSGATGPRELPHDAHIGGVLPHRRQERARLPCVYHLGGAGNDLDRDLGAGAAPTSRCECDCDAHECEE